MSISVQPQDGPLHEAAARGDADALRAATAPGALPPSEIDEPGGRTGQRPLHLAAAHGHAEAARVLEGAGAAEATIGGFRGFCLALRA